MLITRLRPSTLGSRHPPTSHRTFASGASPAVAIKRIAKATACITAAGLGTYYVLDTRAAIYPMVVMPVIRSGMFDPERSHQAAIKLIKYGIYPRDNAPDPACLGTSLWGLPLSNPIGLAAGFDKNGEAVDGILAMGFGSVEIGSVTPKAQPGNPVPRVFRLPNDDAVINRYGFNSDGHEVVVQRLNGRRAVPNRLLGINLGKNKSSAPDMHDDYITGVRSFAKFADYLVINVSSPNTPGLRDLQHVSAFSDLMKAIIAQRDLLIPELGRKVPICVKISPDISEDELRTLTLAALDVNVDGIVVSNTTIQRHSTLKSDPDVIKEVGGLSGDPLFPLALRNVRIVRSIIGDKIPIIGCGGISSSKEALAFARAGATAVQLYTGLVTKGPGIASSIKDDVALYLEENKLTWPELVGTDDQLNHVD